MVAKGSFEAIAGSTDANGLRKKRKLRGVWGNMTRKVTLFVASVRQNPRNQAFASNDTK